MYCTVREVHSHQMIILDLSVNPFLISEIDFHLHSLTAHFTCCAPARPQGATCYINNNISDGIMGQILYSHRYNVPWLESRRYCK